MNNSLNLDEKFINEVENDIKEEVLKIDNLCLRIVVF